MSEYVIVVLVLLVLASAVVVGRAVRARWPAAQDGTLPPGEYPRDLP